MLVLSVLKLLWPQLCRNLSRGVGHGLALLAHLTGTCDTSMCRMPVHALLGGASVYCSWPLLLLPLLARCNVRRYSVHREGAASELAFVRSR